MRWAGPGATMSAMRAPLTLPGALLIAALATPARAEGGPRAGVEAGALLATTMGVSASAGGRNAYSAVPVDPGWIVGGHLEWVPSQSARLGVEVWITGLGVRRHREEAEWTATYVGLAPRLRFTFPLSDAVGLDAQGAFGPAWLSGGTTYGSVGLTARVGMGLSCALTADIEAAVGLSLHAASIWPAEILTPGDDIVVDEPYMHGFRTLMLTLGVRARR